MSRIIPPQPSRAWIGGATAACAALLAPALAAAQLVIHEPGFVVTTLDPAVGAKQVECSPGGVWGDFVYIADSDGGRVERLDFSDQMSPFAGPFSFPVGLIFGPGPAGHFGTFLFVSSFGSSRIEKVDPSGTVFPHASFPSPGSGSFDPTGAYGNAMFIPQAFTGPINKVNPAGGVVLFANVPSAYLKFGPGGAWGTGMYATHHGGAGTGIARVAANGVATVFSPGFAIPEGFDWAFGAAFAGDLFATDVDAGQIWRVKPDGSRTPWATLPRAADVAFCNGALYVVSASGGCYRVNEESVAAAQASWGSLKIRYR